MLATAEKASTRNAPYNDGAPSDPSGPEPAARCPTSAMAVSCSRRVSAPLSKEDERLRRQPSCLYWCSASLAAVRALPGHQVRSRDVYIKPRPWPLEEAITSTSISFIVVPSVCTRRTNLPDHPPAPPTTFKPSRCSSPLLSWPLSWPLPPSPLQRRPRHPLSRPWRLAARGRSSP